ncbi:MAG: PmoA family protein [Bacteroidales bacterium]|nr:PmoA family protein [Bacteroidales bacterium]
MKNKKTSVFILFIAAILIFAVDLFGQESSDASEVRFEHHQPGKKVSIYINDKLFTIYHYNDTLKKPFFFPVCSPEGVIITRGYPIKPRAFERTDHPHQTGCWFNFGDVNGLDFWNNSYAIPKERLHKYGRIVQTQMNISKDGNQGIIEAKMDWISNNGNRILTENTRFIFSKEKNRYIMDRITTLIAEYENVLFGDNKEGLFALRVSRSFELHSDKPAILTGENLKISSVPVINQEGVNGYYIGSNGLEGKEVWGTQNKWISLSAFSGDDSVSIVILDHPKNFGFPSCWHARDYGLFSVNNLGRNAYNNAFEPIELNLPKGDSCIFRHRLVISSDGFLSRNEIEEIFSTFSEKYHE